uniref:C-type lectin domain-containing protein n=1 Tax=Anopheles dirus TaxID=7168 RepID=A0A182NHZ4_9DIPT
MIWRSLLLVCVLCHALHTDGADTTTQEKQYYLSTAKLNWQQAFEFCRAKDMFLMSIHSQDQYNAVLHYLGKSRDLELIILGRRTLWTAFNDINEEGQFYSAATGEKLEFDGWKENEPNNFHHGTCLVENCIVLTLDSHIDLNWQQAFEFCRSRSMFLVTINSQEQLNAVVDYVDRSAYWRLRMFGHVTLWTAFNDINAEGQFFSAATGETLQYEGWKNSEPNNAKFGKCGKEDCVALTRDTHRTADNGFEDKDCNPFEYCRNLGMFLVSIPNQEQMDDVAAVIKQSGFSETRDFVHLWTSLNDIGGEGQFF